MALRNLAAAALRVLPPAPRVAPPTGPRPRLYTSRVRNSAPALNKSLSGAEKELLGVMHARSPIPAALQSIKSSSSYLVSQPPDLTYVQLFSAS
jgi:hypothetical protein